MSKKVVLNGPFEEVIEKDKHLYVIHKLDTICVIPYTIATNTVLDKIGVIKEPNLENENEIYKLISGYVTADDNTNLVAANRLLFEIIGSNVKGADDWMYLGKLSNISGGAVILYAVNISDVDVNNSEEVEEVKKAKKFEMIRSNEVVTSDDALFLAAYLRLFNYFYINSLQEK
jgi:hypothetical protein